MTTRNVSVLSCTVLALSLALVAQAGAEPQGANPSQPTTKYQARAPKTQPFGGAAFTPSRETTLRWLGMAGFFINSRGTTLMVDPVLKGFDMPLMIEMPIADHQVPRLDAVLVTHSDNDHYSVPTCRGVAPVTRAFHSTQDVASLMRNAGLSAVGHDIGDVFSVGQIKVTVTPADHAWQNASPGRSHRVFANEDSARILDRDSRRHDLGSR